MASASTEQTAEQAPFSRIAIAGLGLIGASLAAALRQAYPGIRLFGADIDERTCEIAVAKGWVDGATAPDAPAFSFEDVTFAYHGGGAPALHNITFSAKRGETVGILGGTGSGKSTLVNLLPRFYPASRGAVKLDGVNVNAIPAETLRERVGVVPQKAVLFKGTIRSNLLWGNGGATEEQLARAVRLAQAEDVVKAKGGLDAPVEQEGKNLSGGQRQRLTIARALVRDPEVLILDDSSSALDYATDARLREALRGLDCTVLIVSQRTASVRHADKIVVLDDGGIAGIGTHEQLMGSCALYREIAASQAKEALQ